MNEGRLGKCTAFAERLEQVFELYDQLEMKRNRKLFRITLIDGEGN